jgi:hypothetical protein
VSITHNREIRCQCGALLTVTVAESINAGRHPHLRQAILDCELHRFTCEACGLTQVVDTTFSYLDHERRQFFVVMPRGELVNEAAAIEQVKELFDLSFGALAPPGVQELGRGMMVRLCFGLLAVRDKIVADAAALNDLFLEELKCIVLTQQARLVDLQIGALWLDRVEGDHLVLLAESGEESNHRAVHVPRAVYDSIAAHGERAVLEERPQLVSGPHVSMLRLGLA